MTLDVYIFKYFKNRLIPNSCSKIKSERRKVFIGDQLNECKDFSGLFYILPYQKVCLYLKIYF